jgi:hypothetical protein
VEWLLLYPAGATKYGPEERVSLRQIFLNLALLGMSPGILPAACAQQSAKASDKREESATLGAILALKDPSLPGEVPTYYTPGFKKRAQAMQDLLAGQRAFYRMELGSQADLTMAVLNAEQWARLNIRDPYGIPTIPDDPPYLALMPADWNEVHLGMLPDEKDANRLLVKQVQSAGVEWRQTLYRGFDTMIGHEYGHAVTVAYGIQAPNRWFNEFLATYFLVAYVREKQPQLAFPMHIFFSVGMDYPHPYTSLADFETHYPISDSLPANYAWYQSMFEKRIEEVYARNGVDFLKRVKVAFPSGGKSDAMSNAEVLKKLDEICPGFTEWAHSFDDAGKAK